MKSRMIENVLLKAKLKCMDERLNELEEVQIIFAQTNVSQKN